MKLNYYEKKEMIALTHEEKESYENQKKLLYMRKSI